MSDDPFLKIDGANAYLVTQWEWTGTIVSHWLVTAPSLAEAKRTDGWTRQMHATRTVRRARQSDSHHPHRP